MPEPASRPAASPPPSDAAALAAGEGLALGASTAAVLRANERHGAHRTGNNHLHKLALAALGVVFGDIGTSPLYAMRECFHGEHAIAPTPNNVIGVLSLIFWSLTLVVSIKYVAYVLRADNKGEGGILALMALSSSSLRQSRAYVVLITLGVFGAALLYGDGVITPAISVLSAVEGLNVA